MGNILGSSVFASMANTKDGHIHSSLIEQVYDDFVVNRTRRYQLLKFLQHLSIPDAFPTFVDHVYWTGHTDSCVQIIFLIGA